MNSDIQVYQSSLFRRAYKRLHQNQKADVDDAITEIINDQTVGEQKKGDLAGVFVYKFKCNRIMSIEMSLFFEKNIHFSAGFSTTSRLITHVLAGLVPQLSGLSSLARRKVAFRCSKIALE